MFLGRTGAWWLEWLIIPSLLGVIAAALVSVMRDGGWEGITVWTGVQALATIGALIAAVVLWDETAKQRETELMLRLIEEYDGLRVSADFVHSYYRWCLNHGPVDPIRNFSENIHPDVREERATEVDDARYEVSRFFVKIRRLVTTRYLSEHIVLNSLDRRAVEMFLEKIDPLDEAKAGSNYQRADRDFFSALLKKYSHEEQALTES